MDMVVEADEKHHMSYLSFECHKLWKASNESNSMPTCLQQYSRIIGSNQVALVPTGLPLLLLLVAIFVYPLTALGRAWCKCCGSA